MSVPNPSPVLFASPLVSAEATGGGEGSAGAADGFPWQLLCAIPGRSFAPSARLPCVPPLSTPQKHQAEARDPRVRLMVGDQANGTFLEQVVAEIKSAVGLLDFIVDDGGHTMDQHQTSLKHLLPLVKPCFPCNPSLVLLLLTVCPTSA
ncbi:unnamed protein product [Closterium sp. Naga37s-1]|nr:unnamed protein product [Closterium sp. Naga37s-1]